MNLSRRSLITGLMSLVAAPAIVRCSSLMPVKAWAGEAPVLRGLNGLIPYYTVTDFEQFSLGKLNLAPGGLNYVDPYPGCRFRYDETLGAMFHEPDPSAAQS